MIIELLVFSFGITAVLLVGIAFGKSIAAQEANEKFLQGQFMGVSSILIDIPPENQAEMLRRLTERWDDKGKRNAAVLLGAAAYHQWRRDNPDAWMVEGPEYMTAFKRRAEKGDVR